jgi:hypothetical protein
MAARQQTVPENLGLLLLSRHHLRMRSNVPDQARPKAVACIRKLDASR